MKEMVLEKGWVIKIRGADVSIDGETVPILYHRHAGKSIEGTFDDDHQALYINKSITLRCPDCNRRTPEAVSGYLNLCRWSYGTSLRTQNDGGIT